MWINKAYITMYIRTDSVKISYIYLNQNVKCKSVMLNIPLHNLQYGGTIYGTYYCHFSTHILIQWLNACYVVWATHLCRNSYSYSKLQFDETIFLLPFSTLDSTSVFVQWHNIVT